MYSLKGQYKICRYGCCTKLPSKIFYAAASSCCHPKLKVYIWYLNFIVRLHTHIISKYTHAHTHSCVHVYTYTDMNTYTCTFISWLTHELQHSILHHKPMIGNAITDC